MKALTILCVTLVFSGVVSAQELHKVSSSIPDSLLWPSLQNSTYKYHIRVFISDQSIDLFSNDNNQYNGFVTNYISQVRYVKVEYGPSYIPVFRYYQKVPLSPSLSTSIAAHLLRTGQDTIPTDSLIKGWNYLIYDCKGIYYQFKTNNKYHSESISCPSSQLDTVPYVQILRANFQYLIDTLQLDSLFSRFRNILPRGKLYTNNGANFTYRRTLREQALYDKYAPHRAYMKSVNDTLNNYLSTTLTKIFEVRGGFRCPTRFLLEFSKEEKLLSVYSYAPWKDLSHAHKLEVNNCKQQIIDAFKHIRIDFIKPKHNYSRNLSYSYDHTKLIISAPFSYY